MSNFLSSFIVSTDVTEEEKQATRRTLRTILLIVIATSVLISIDDGIIFGRLPTLYALAPLALVSIISLYYLNRQVLWPARIIIPLGTVISISYIIWMGNGLHDIGISSLGIVIILAGLTLGGNGAIAFGIITALAVVITGIAEMNGLIAYPFGEIAISDIVIVSTIVIAGSFLLRLLLTRLQVTIVQLQRSEYEQRNANAELLNLKTSLENRVEERTTELSRRGVELEIANRQIKSPCGPVRGVGTGRAIHLLDSRHTGTVATCGTSHQRKIRLLSEYEADEDPWTAVPRYLRAMKEAIS